MKLRAILGAGAVAFTLMGTSALTTAAFPASFVRLRMSLFSQRVTRRLAPE